MNRNNVVLPEPFGPTRPTFSPAFNWNEASTKRIWRPYCLLMRLSEIMRSSRDGNVQLGAEQHRSIVVARGPFEQRRHGPLGTRFHRGLPIHHDHDRLVEIESVRRDEEREFRDAAGAHSNAVA